MIGNNPIVMTCNILGHITTDIGCDFIRANTLCAKVQDIETSPGLRFTKLYHLSEVYVLMAHKKFHKRLIRLAKVDDLSNSIDLN